MRLIVMSIMVTLLSGCGSIISRTIPGQAGAWQPILSRCAMGRA